MAADISQQICKIWDEDAATYDESPAHCPQRPHEVAAWRATLRRLLPDPPARVLDAGAGTGFISLILADQGYEVTAVDLSGQMLAILRSKADRRGLNVKIVHADAADPPPGHTFNAVRRAPSNMDSGRAGRSPNRMAQGSPDGPLGTHRGDLGQDKWGGRRAGDGT